MKKKLLHLLLICSLVLVGSCQQVTTGFVDDVDRTPGSTGGGTPGNQNAINQALQDALNNAYNSDDPVVEIRYFIEPKVDTDSNGGTYLRKLTIPKDYRGFLYLAGLNIATLQGKNVKARFKFGVGGQYEKVIPASIVQAPGLLQNSSVSVLELDLRDRPFAQMSLQYDLYDYNDYTFDGSSDASALSSAVKYNRDTKLYCRGLSLQDDPTFTGDISNKCKNTDDICKYAYASVEDQGLTYTNQFGMVGIPPSRGNIQAGTSGYYADTDEEKLKRCLADNPQKQNLALGNLFTYDLATGFGLLTTHTINGVAYTYRGPYRVTATEDWQIELDSAASLNKYGIFSSPVTPGIEFYRYGSKLFPRYVKKNLSSGVEYLGSATPNDAKTLQSMSSTGESLWMDGCIERATTKDIDDGEHVGSCNVTASIEVYYEDNGVERQVDMTKEVKLQIVKESFFENSEDTDVIGTNFQACSSTSQCGSGECCINNRCWDKTIVSSCFQDEPSSGNLVTGASCTNDYQCASLCCNGGTCQPHDGTNNFCSKPVGQSCVAKPWCQKQNVSRCFIVKTVVTNGVQQCALKCYNNQESGECNNGTCEAPVSPTPPTFDPNAADRCDDACEEPTINDGVFNINCPSS